MILRSRFTLLITACITLSLVIQANADILYDSAAFSNFQVVTDDASGFSGTSDIVENGVVVGVLEASVDYLGGTNPFNSGDGWGPTGPQDGEFSVAGNSTDDGEPMQTATGFWELSITPNAGFTVDGISLFSTTGVLANPTFGNLNSNGLASVSDSTDLISSHNDGESFANGSDLIFNPGSLATGIPIDDHRRNWALNSEGATSLSFFYLAGPVSDITLEGLVIDTSVSGGAGVPEPSACCLLVTGLAMLVSRRKR